MKGPGTIIRETLKKFGITDNGCGCTALANEMDSVGPNYLELHLDEYTQKMKDSISRWKKISGLPIPQPPEVTIRILLLFAIQQSSNSDHSQVL